MNSRPSPSSQEQAGGVIAAGVVQLGQHVGGCFILAAHVDGGEVGFACLGLSLAGVAAQHERLASFVEQAAHTVDGF